MHNYLSDTELDFVYLDLCSNLISSKMKSLKYLKLNFLPYSCGCNLSFSSTRSNYVDLQFNQLIIRNKSLSNLETLFIGSKLFLFSSIHIRARYRSSFRDPTRDQRYFLPNQSNFFEKLSAFLKHDLKEVLTYMRVEIRSSLSQT